MNNPFTIAIHGGAGTILRSDMTPELEQEYVAALDSALAAGYLLLAGGGSATDAVVAATVVLEDHILFNAGRGSVFTKDGRHEMDAALMDGRTLGAGAVTGIRNLRNPIVLAQRVMRDTQHVFLSGDGALEFAREQGLPFEADHYFFSQTRYDQWLSVRHTDRVLIDHTNEYKDEYPDKKFGTVGAVACDAQGNVAAATSTGGMTNKQWGRIGDSPIIGAGTYARNATCAISCTGHGELFIKAVAAYDVSCLMEYKGLSLQEAMDVVVNDKLVRIGGEGGMIGVDARGNHALLFNSDGMYRGVRNSEGLKQIGIYK
ncbi:isoaspartyl peptidase/L-asparaginase family protein [Flaviaesturariibacter aridisoli]|uniref:Isoaspartyl peptidase n=1 Tax=Flaviaesturariibacter aridisoli TaxID=2545761 RepID=A0A4R4E9N1_9BACT|nr:isoaspartyl peptidase/L-asparaginase [Flaviaesturariibacter aridisoli]TCZ74558.1 isoaspartyl peptidase/L-asparaginase [Flaviaesturariibacter aridisoli]